MGNFRKTGANLKITLRKLLLITLRIASALRAKGGERYVKIHNGRNRKALWSDGENGSVLRHKGNFNPDRTHGGGQAPLFRERLKSLKNNLLLQGT